MPNTTHCHQPAMISWLKYPLILLSCLLILVLLLLFSLPLSVPLLVEQLSPRWLDGRQLRIADLEIDYSESQFTLKNIQLIDKGKASLTLERLEIDLAPAQLWHKTVKVERLLLAHGKTSVRQQKQAWEIAGILLNNRPEKQPQSSQTNPEQKGLTPWQIELNELRFQHLLIDIQHSSIQSQLNFKQIELNHFNSAAKQLNSELKIQLAMDNTQAFVSSQSLSLADNANVQSHIKLSGSSSKPDIALDLSLNDIAISNSMGILLAVEKVALGNMQHQSFTDLNSSLTQLERFDIEQLTLLPSKLPQQAALVQLAKAQIKGIKRQKQSTQISQINLAGIRSHIDLIKHYHIRQLDLIQDLIPASPESPTQQSNAASPVMIHELTLQQGWLTIADHNFKPAVTNQILIENLLAGPFNSADKHHNLSIDLEAKVNQLANLKSQANIQKLGKKPSLEAQYQLTGFDLVDESAYLEKASGYFVHTGQLNSQGEINIHEGLLKSLIKLRLNAIKLERSNAEHATKIDSAIPFPLDTTLGLLRDKHGDIKLELPIEGDINSPEFDPSDALSQVGQHALEQASLLYLQQAFQPYGALISVGSWLHDQSQKIQLDPLVFEPGQTQLSVKQQDYLNKLGQLLSNKALRVKACPITSELEQTWYKQQKEKANTETGTADLAQINQARLGALRLYLDNHFQLGEGQIINCKAQNAKGSDKIKNSYIQLAM